MESVFLSGFGIDGRIWNDRYPLSQSKFRPARVLDWPDAKPPTLQAAAEALIDQIPDQATVIGWSFGGLMAMQLAALFPSKVARLVLIAATPKFIQSFDWPGVTAAHSERFLSLAETEMEALSPYFLKLVNYPNSSPNFKRYIGSYLYRLEEKKAQWVHYLKLFMQADLRNVYSHLTVPTVHLLGEEDAVIQVEISALQQLNPKIQFSLIRGAGHALFVTHAAACETSF